MAVVVTYRKKDETEVVASCPNEKEALKAAIEFLKGLGVDEDDLDGNTWEEAVQKWEWITEGYEQFSFRKA